LGVTNLELKRSSRFGVELDRDIRLIVIGRRIHVVDFDRARIMQAPVVVLIWQETAC
jgi:hypothetical protein